MKLADEFTLLKAVFKKLMSFYSIKVNKCNIHSNLVIALTFGVTHKNNNILLLIQKRAIQAICNLQLMDLYRDYFRELKTMNVVNLIVYKTVLLLLIIKKPYIM